MKKDNKLIFKKIYNEIKINPKVTEKTLSNKFNYSERTIRRYMKILKDDKKIYLDGYGRKKIWKLGKWNVQFILFIWYNIINF